MPQYFHGGIPGLKPGDLIVPHAPNIVDNCPVCAAKARGENAVIPGLGAVDPLTGRPDRVYMTTDREYARQPSSTRLCRLASTFESGFCVSLTAPALARSGPWDRVEIIAAVRMAFRAVGLCLVQGQEGVPAPRLVLTVRRRFKVSRVAALTMAACSTARAGQVTVVTEMVYVEALRERPVLQFIDHAVRRFRACALDVYLAISVASDAPGPQPAFIGPSLFDVSPHASRQVLFSGPAVHGGVASLIPRLVMRLAVSPAVVRPTAAVEAAYSAHPAILAEFFYVYRWESFASKFPHGDLYTVEPVGEIELSDEDHFPTWTAPAARVRGVYDRYVQLTPGQRTRLLRRWKKQDAIAARTAQITR